MRVLYSRERANNIPAGPAGYKWKRKRMEGAHSQPQPQAQIRGKMRKNLPRLGGGKAAGFNRSVAVSKKEEHRATTKRNKQ